MLRRNSRTCYALLHAQTIAAHSFRVDAVFSRSICSTGVRPCLSSISLICARPSPRRGNPTASKLPRFVVVSHSRVQSSAFSSPHDQFSSADGLSPRLPGRTAPDGQITSLNPKQCQAGPRKIFTFRFPEIHDYPLAIPPPLEGRIAIVTDVGSGMRWTRGCFSALARRRKASARTAKPCGPVV